MASEAYSTELSQHTHQNVSDARELLCARISSHLTFIELGRVMCVFDIVKGFNIQNFDITSAATAGGGGYDAGSTRNLYMNNIRDISIRSIQMFFFLSLFKYEKNASPKRNFTFEIENLKYNSNISSAIFAVVVHLNKINIRLRSGSMRRFHVIIGGIFMRRLSNALHAKHKYVQNKMLPLNFA